MLLQFLSSVAQGMAGFLDPGRRPANKGGSRKYGWVSWVVVLAAVLSPQVSGATFQVARFQLAEDGQVTAVPVETNAPLKVVIGVPQPSLDGPK